MSHARTCSMVAIGVEGHVVEVEAHISPGLPAMVIVGLPDTSVAESRDRARSAVLNSGLPWPKTRLTVGLSPAWLPKTGSGLDLAITMASLAADGTVPAEAIGRTLFVGELGLDGRIRAVRGALIAALTARNGGFDRVVVPVANVAEAKLVTGVVVIGAADLAALVGSLRGEMSIDSLTHSGVEVVAEKSPPLPDLADVRGQAAARFAFEVAAAGAHHIAMIGPPGVGKTLLAERLPGILPPLSDDEALEVTAVRSVTGLLSHSAGLDRGAPFCAPHHTATFAAMVGGGGGRSPRVGLVSVAHRGVLFLDEAPEFAPRVLDALRQPLESGVITVARVGFTTQLPSRFQLVLAANPCPCGHAGAQSEVQCTCSASQQRRYLARLSGPLLDRVDIRLVLAKPTPAELAFDDQRGEASAIVAARVHMARERMLRRFTGTPWRVNAEVPGVELRRRLSLKGDAVDALEAVLRQPSASARGVDRIVRIAQTVADLGGREQPSARDINHAAALRDASGQWAA